MDFCWNKFGAKKGKRRGTTGSKSRVIFEMQMGLLSRRQINPSKINFRPSKIRKGDVQKHTYIYIYIHPKCKGLLVWTEETGIPVAWKIQLLFLTIAFRPSILNILFFFFLSYFYSLPLSQYWNTSGNNSGGGGGISNSILHFVLLAKLILFATQFLLFLHALYKIQNTISDCFIRTTSISSILFLFSILKRSNKNSPWKFLYPTL